MNKSVQAGFTLIELVMVIVILGVLSAVALPKFVAVDDDAKQAAVNGFAGALSSASAINYAGRKANGNNGVAVTKCSDVIAMLQSPLPTGFSVTTDSTAAANITVSTCVLTGHIDKTATFTVTGIL
ncbi:type II secretion system protein [Roseateles sp. P5_D6]